MAHKGDDGQLLYYYPNYLVLFELIENSDGMFVVNGNLVGTSQVNLKDFGVVRAVAVEGKCRESLPFSKNHRSELKIDRKMRDTFLRIVSQSSVRYQRYPDYIQKVMPYEPVEVEVNEFET